MSTEIDYDKLSDEEFMNILEDVESVDDTEPEGDIEDTDHDGDHADSDNDDTETSEYYDDSEADTEDDFDEDDDDDNEENSQNDETNEAVNSDDDESDDDESDNDENSDDDLTDDQKADLDSATEGMSKQEKIDYKKAYEDAIAEKEQYENFYKQATSEFVANGKVMKGFNDPKKIIQAQQMAAGFSEKMKAFKKYRPFINPLKEKGMLENPEKFNLMLNALDGDKEAIKKIIQNAEIDPIELDMDNINYQPKNQISSDIEVAFDDVLETATQYGVKDKVEQVIANDWDDGSVIELLEDPQNSADLVNHLSTGVYDLVQQRINEKKISDPYSAFNNKRAIDQYREAANELEQEYLIALQEQQNSMMQEQQYSNDQQQQVANDSFNFSEDEIQAEIEKIKQEQEYANKVKEKNAEADKGRKKAASVSKRKSKTRKQDTKFDPGKMSDEEFTEYLDNMIFG
jgi:hypothetical protein